jgi:hypothetical protein
MICNSDAGFPPVMLATKISQLVKSKFVAWPEQAVGECLNFVEVA